MGRRTGQIVSIGNERVVAPLGGSKNPSKLRRWRATETRGRLSVFTKDAWQPMADDLR